MGGVALDIVFDWTFDGSVWPGAAIPSFGEAWLGPQGLLNRLELELGLGTRNATALERAVALSRTLGDGFWSASLEIDPIATARRLLEDRDLLVSWGWQGEPASERLAALWAATIDAHLGIPDRVFRVIEELARERVGIARVTCFESIATYPPIWQRLLRALERSGVPIIVRSLGTATATGDLAAARTPGFVPLGDETLQLFRPHAVLAAADEIAALLAVASDDASVLLVGPDAVLDAALGRHGVPRIGADLATPGSAALLRACIESAFHPMDTADLHALVCADPGPVPRNVAWALSNALGKHAGRGSELWRNALASQLALLEDDARGPVARRLTTLLDPIAHRDEPIATSEIEARLATLEAWARGRQLDELATRIHQLVRLLCGTERVSRGQLLQLCDELEAPTVAAPTGEVGLYSVQVPGAMAGTARIVIWWGFTRDRVSPLPHLHLSLAERRVLGDAAPDLGAIMAADARRWRRPLDLATDTLVLVCPRTDAVGDRAYPHPLWDELVAAMPTPALQSRVERDRPMLTKGIRARRQVVPVRARPRPFSEAFAPNPLTLRSEESASSLEQLIGCSVAYVLRYRGRLRPRLAARPAVPGPLLYGNVAHYVLARVFATGGMPPMEASARAEAMFDAELPAIAEPLLLPNHQAERAMVRRAVSESARLIAAMLGATRGRIRGLEVELRRTVGPAAVASRADLVFEAPGHVIDFKWGTSTHRDALRAGAAVQLAVYAELLGRDVGAAFLSLRDRRVLAARGSGIPLAAEPGSHTVADMIDAMVRAIDRRVAELTEGRLFAPGAAADAAPSRIEGGMLQLAPDCKTCELAALCGRRGRT